MAAWQARRKLPNRRRTTRQRFQVGDHTIYLGIGHFADGTVGEIFVKMDKEGDVVGALLDAFAISVSYGLQHGVPLERFVDAYTFNRFAPFGPVQGHPRIKFCTSLLDLIARYLGVEYLDRDELAQVAAEDVMSPTAGPEADVVEDIEDDITEPPG